MSTPAQTAEVGETSQRLAALNTATQRAGALGDVEAVYAVFAEALEETGLKFVFASAADDGGKLTIQSTCRTRSVDLGRLESLVGKKLVGLTLTPGFVAMLHETLANGKVTLLDDPRKAFQEVVPSTRGSWARRPVERLTAPAVCAVVPLGANGTISDLLIVWSPNLRQEDVPMVTALANQLTLAVENAKLRHTVSDREEQIKLLVKTTIDAQETERERICLEVHDGVAQTLASAFQYLQVLENTPDTQVSQARNLANKASGLLKQAIQEAREVISSLQPATLGGLGLVATLRQELHDLSTEAGWKIDFSADSFRLPKDEETALYRIIHEALANIKKHAKTDRVSVKLERRTEQVVVEVRDWGAGFELRPSWLSAGQQGTGLLSMHRRAEMLGGVCRIESILRLGTTVTVKVPVTEEPEGGDHGRAENKSTDR